MKKKSQKEADALLVSAFLRAVDHALYRGYDVLPASAWKAIKAGRLPYRWRSHARRILAPALLALFNACSGWIDVQIPPCPQDANTAQLVSTCDRVCAADGNSRAGGNLCFAGQTVLSCICQDGNAVVEKK